MVPKSLRRGIPAPSARRSAKRLRPRIEQLEDRTAPALFTVKTPVTINGTANFGCLATGDFNGDGKTDMVLTNYGTAAPGNNAGGNNMSVVLGNGNGTFGTANTITLGTNKYVSFVAVGDLNGDGKQDLAVVSSNEDTSGELRIYLGTGLGGFTLTSQGAIQTGSNNACWVGIAQMTNGDTNPDVVVSAFGTTDSGQTTVFGNEITIFQGDGTGQVANIGNVGNGLAFLPTALALADFDGDGNMDIAATVPGVPPDTTDPQPNGTVQLLMGNGAGGFTVGNSFDSGGALPISMATTDFNGDGRPDLVIANAGDPDANNFYANFGSNSSVGVAINAGGGSFNTNSMTAGFGVGGSKSVFAVTVADFDLDGKKDIAGILYGSPATSAHARVLEYKGDGNGGFAADANSPYDTTTTDGQYLAAAPLDGNTSPDIVYSNAIGKYGVLTNNTATGPSVTINQAAGQADPTNSSPIAYAVHFSESVSGFDASDISFTGSTVGGTLQAAVSGSGQDYSVTVTGMSGSGTVKASIPAGAATADAGGAASAASTSTDNTVTFDNVGPTVTINQASGQADPTSTGPIVFTAVFSESVTGFTGSDISFTGSTVGGTLSANVTGSGTTYTVSVSGMSGNGTVVASVVAGAVTDSLGNPSAASTSTDNTVTFNTPGPTVTINQGTGQADPTNASPITFDAVFSEGVTGFTGSDIAFTGSTVGGTLSASVTQIDSSHYTVSITGMSGNGTIVASIPAGAATGISDGLTSQASTSIDNTVTFDGVGPSVTINQAAGQADPATSGPIQFTAVFSESVTGFTGSDISFTGSTVAGALTANVTGSGTTYTVSVSGMSGNGTVVASVVAGAATDSVGNPSAASTSTDNVVVFGDIVSPSVTINQAVGQTDPTNVPSVSFDVKFSEPVIGFASGDVSLAGSTVGGALSVTVTGSLDTYLVTVAGITSRGLVIASIPAAGVTDAAGNPNNASTSTDNSVEFINTGTLGFKQATFNGAEDDVPPPPGNPTFITVTVTRTGGTDGAVSIHYATADDTAHSGGSVPKGQADYTPTSGTLSWADGIGGDKTFTVEILPDKLNEGKELIKLTLDQETGNPVLGLTAAKAAIAPSDGQGPGIYLDQDNDKYTIKLNGRTGSLVYYRTDPDGDSKGPIELINLTGTQPDALKPVSSLLILVTKPRNSPTDGIVQIGAITGSGLRSITARKSDLNLEGINLDGYLGALTIGNILNGADITTLGTTNVMQKTRIRAGVIGNFTAINVGAGLSSLTATSFGDGSLTAPSVASINIRENFAADVTVTGVGVDPARRALGALRVRGAVAGSNIMVDGNVGTVAVGAFRDSRLFAGYTGADDGSGTFDPDHPATIIAFRSSSKVQGFQNSWVIADTIKSVRLTNVVSANATDFGFYADTKIGAVSVLGPSKWAYDPQIQGPQGIDPKFVVTIV